MRSYEAVHGHRSPRKKASSLLLKYLLNKWTIKAWQIVIYAFKLCTWYRIEWTSWSPESETKQNMNKLPVWSNIKKNYLQLLRNIFEHVFYLLFFNFLHFLIEKNCNSLRTVKQLVIETYIYLHITEFIAV